MLEVGDRGKEATLANALTRCRAFGLRPQEAADLMEEMRLAVAAEWRSACVEAGVPRAEMERMATCFREAERADWFLGTGVVPTGRGTSSAPGREN